MPNGEINRYPYCPVPFGRTTFATVADKFIQDRGMVYLQGRYFLEFGSTRSLMDMGAGYSTPFLTWLAYEAKQKFVSIDNKTEVTDISNKICADYFPTCKPAITSDAVKFATDMEVGKISLLYLDAYDYDGSDENKELSKQKHLELFALCEPHLAENALVMIDDVLNLDTYEGKGQLLIPELLGKGYKMLVKDYCCLLEKP